MGRQEHTTDNRADTEDSRFLKHGPCEDCGSSDARAYYTDHEFCFSCSVHKQTQNKTQPAQMTQPSTHNFLSVEYGDIPKRKLREDTCRKYGYGITDKFQVASYRDTDGRIVAQKLRDANKNFSIVGDAKKMTLFGQHLWSGGKQLVICEGEIDTCSMAQVQNLKWPVVGIPNGAQSASRAICNNIEFVELFDKVIFMFDEDKPGRDAAVDCAGLLSPGKAHIAQLPEGMKDVNDMLVAGRESELVSVMWSAKPHRPDGLVFKEEIYAAVTDFSEVESYDYPWEGFNKTTFGLRRGELVVVTAGTGVGKSTICREIAYHLSKQTPIAYIALEENIRQSAMQFLGIHTNKALHLNYDLEPEELDTAFNEVFGDDNIVLYDHFGSIDPDNMMSKIKFLAHAGYKYIFLDHITLMLSGGADQGDERRRIDAVMTKLRQAVENLNIGLIIVSHLKRVEGKPMEEGGRTSLSHLRGSTQIAGLADICIGLERDQQDADNPNLILARCLKNRFSGDTGVMQMLNFDRNKMQFIPTVKSTATDFEF